MQCSVLPAKVDYSRHWRLTMIWPLVLLSLLFLWVYASEFDQRLATWLFQLQGGQWLLKEHWLTETLLHQAVRQLNQLVVLILLVYWLGHFIFGTRSKHQQALGLLLLSLACSYISIALLKKFIPMECPWDLQQFGGNQPFIGLFSTRPAALAPNQCFPAGHASIGYSWLASYYFLLLVRPSLAKAGLWCSIGLGLLLGFTQQLRGAHFISHDIATAAICWLIASFNFQRLHRQYPRRSTTNVEVAQQLQTPSLNLPVPNDVRKVP